MPKIKWEDKIKLARLASFDARDNDHLLPEPRRMTSLRERTWNRGPGAAWNQGETSQCVSYSANRLFVAGPITNKMPLSFIEFYHRCQDVDEWPGRAYEGTSCRAAMKVGVSLGLILGYKWAPSVEAAVQFMLTKGPLLAGTIWTVPMFYPFKYKRQMFIKVEGIADSAGGHAYFLYGVNRNIQCPDGTKGAFRLLNSWGPVWGEKGAAWVSFADMELLYQAAGDLVMAEEIKVKLKALPAPLQLPKVSKAKAA